MKKNIKEKPLVIIQCYEVSIFLLYVYIKTKTFFLNKSTTKSSEGRQVYFPRRASLNCNNDY